VGPEQVIALGRNAMETALWVAAPILLVVATISVVISIIQVLTSIQDPTISAVPRLAAVAGTVLLLMHWILRRLVGFTVHSFSDFRPWAR
jgi:flagellar biosynthetic protein FliQ